MAKKKKGRVHVKGHKWSRGKNKRHPGYWRKKRSKGKRRIVDKNPVKGMHAIRDEHGRIHGYVKRKR